MIERLSLHLPPIPPFLLPFLLQLTVAIIRNTYKFRGQESKQATHCITDVGDGCFFNLGGIVRLYRFLQTCNFMQHSSKTIIKHIGRKLFPETGTIKYTAVIVVDKGNPIDTPLVVTAHYQINVHCL